MKETLGYILDLILMLIPLVSNNWTTGWMMFSQPVGGCEDAEAGPLSFDPRVGRSHLQRQGQRWSGLSSCETGVSSHEEVSEPGRAALTEIPCRKENDGTEGYDWDMTMLPNWFRYQPVIADVMNNHGLPKLISLRNSWYVSLSFRTCKGHHFWESKPFGHTFQDCTTILKWKLKWRTNGQECIIKIIKLWPCGFLLQVVRLTG